MKLYTVFLTATLALLTSAEVMGGVDPAAQQGTPGSAHSHLVIRLAPNPAPLDLLTELSDSVLSSQFAQVISFVKTFLLEVDVIPVGDGTIIAGGGTTCTGPINSSVAPIFPFTQEAFDLSVQGNILSIPTLAGNGGTITGLIDDSLVPPPSFIALPQSESPDEVKGQ